jgi:hypothetical protein
MVLAPMGAEQAPQNAPSAAEQNLLIVTVMSFDRSGIIKHNHHVQTRADFLPNSARHLPGQEAVPVLRLRYASEIRLSSSSAAGLRADCPGALPYDGQKADR